MLELRLGLRAKLRLSVIICAVLDLLPTKKENKKTTSTSFRRYWNDIEMITIYQNFDIFLDDIDTIRYGQYRLESLDISFGRYIVASLVVMGLWERSVSDQAGSNYYQSL